MNSLAFEVRPPLTRRVSVGTAAADVLPTALDEIDAKRVFLLVGTTLSQNDEALGGIRASLEGRIVAEYSKIRPHVLFEDLVDATAALRDSGSDVIVSIGGGSIGEAAKVLPLCLKYGVTSVDDAADFRVAYAWDGTTDQNDESTAPEIPVISIPTTLSAGEYNHRHGVTWPDVGKRGLSHVESAPHTIILDPYLTKFTPDWVWNSTGVRAIDHAVEAILSPWNNSYWQPSQIAALQSLTSGLRALANDRNDVEARTRCQVGAWQSIASFINGVPFGLSHAIGHSLGGLFSVPHGYTSCVIMAAVQDWNAEAQTEGQDLVASALGRPGERVGDTLTELIAGLGLPTCLDDVAVTPDQYAAIAGSVMGDHLTHKNARTVTGPEDVIDVLKRAQSRGIRTTLSAGG